MAILQEFLIARQQAVCVEDRHMQPDGPLVFDDLDPGLRSMWADYSEQRKRAQLQQEAGPLKLWLAGVPLGKCPSA